MSRTVVFGSLMPDPDNEPERRDLLTKVGGAAAFEHSKKGGEMLRKELRSAWPERPPRVLDCFAGGGAIPLEASRLGCEVHALDINPVSHLIFPSQARVVRQSISGAEPCAARTALAAEKYRSSNHASSRTQAVGRCVSTSPSVATPSQSRSLQVNRQMDQTGRKGQRRQAQ